MTEALALRVLAEPLEHGEAKPIAVNIALAPIQPLAGGESQSRARRT